MESDESFSDLLLSISKSTLAKSKSTLHHDYWADGVEKLVYDSLSKTERKRQENLYELIYTEKDYVQSLEYLQNVKKKNVLVLFNSYKTKQILR